MSHSLVRVHIHYVWNTKYREYLLIGNARETVREHIWKYAEQNDIVLEALNVQPEHVHLLAELERDRKIEEIAKLLKGESSHWINENNIVRPKFSWQTGYAAFSVSYQDIKSVKRYINGQDEHHRHKPFAEEFEEMLRKSGYSDVEIAELLRGGNR